MATIRPFRAIRPNPLFAQQLIGTAKDSLICSGTLQPLKTQLETIARQRPETEAGQQVAYDKIKKRLQTLITEERLWREEKPGIYVYESVKGNLRQTGIWAQTLLSDFTEGRIKTHERTLHDNVRRQKNYREHTGLEGNPVVLAYPPDVLINRIIADTKAGCSRSSVGNRFGFHRLWKIEQEETLELLVAAFGRVPMVYLADGHHRLESASVLATEQESSGRKVFGTISSLYLSTDQLKIREFDRVVLPDPPIKKESLFDQLRCHFHLREATGNRPVRPEGQHNLGMYAQGTWYHLLAKEPEGYCPHDCNCIGAVILQEKVLGPVQIYQGIGC
ncbi:MAG: DUF1015 family protein [Sphingobacteriales bacterium]